MPGAPRGRALTIVSRSVHPGQPAAPPRLAAPSRALEDLMPEPWDTQREALGAFIRTQRKLANLSLRQLAEMTSLSNPLPEPGGAWPAPAVGPGAQAHLRRAERVGGNPARAGRTAGWRPGQGRGRRWPGRRHAAG